MGTVVAVAEPEARQEDSEQPAWSPATRIAFRFCFLYFGLFCLTYPQPVTVFLGWAIRWLPEDAVMWQAHVLEPLLRRVGRGVFGADAAVRDTGSGDQAVFWVLLFCLLVVSVVGTLVWSVVDRNARDHRRLAGWFLLFIRMCVGGQMLFYGFAKMIPTQMPEPGLATLLEPFGNLAPMGVLWNQVGVSQPYEILLGTAEVLAGLLLFVPRTALLGAMLAVISMAQVFVLNMTFDVPVKILSGHLLLMGLVLLAPEARRLFEVLVANRTAPPSHAPYPFRTRRGRRWATVGQAALAVWLLAALIPLSWQAWEELGPHRERPPLYGIWTVAEFTRDGQPVPPLLTDETRWRRIVFDQPEIMEYQRIDGELVPLRARVDTDARRLDLAPADSAGDYRPGSSRHGDMSGSLSYQRPTSDRLVLDGQLDGRPVTVTLDRLDPNSFPVRGRGFHWVQEGATF
ncbi:DoxX family protein [Nocardia sp. NPDC003482]